MPAEPRFERREPGDQSFLAGVALDLAFCQERAIPLANRADHAGINSEGVGGTPRIAVLCRAGQAAIVRPGVASSAGVLGAVTSTSWQPCNSAHKLINIG